MGLWKKASGGDVFFSANVYTKGIIPLVSMSPILSVTPQGASESGDFLTFNLPTSSNSSITIVSGGEYIGSADYAFMVPEDGLYQINFDVLVGDGGFVLDSSTYSRSYLTIIKNRTILHSRVFVGLGVLTAYVLPHRAINQSYYLKKNDRINFGVITKSAVGGLYKELDKINASISLHKIK